MSLHGNIQVNHRPLWEWAARNTTGNPTGSNDYDVILFKRPSPFSKEPVARTVITHEHEDGALVLASKVLAWAAGRSLE